MIYDIIGTIYKPSGVMLTDIDGNDYPEMVAIDGYHVNILPQEDISLVQQYIVTVNTPNRVFAGVEDTVALKFADRSEWLALGIETIEETV